MGYFAYAYVIEGTTEWDAIVLSVTAYSLPGSSLLSWGPGNRPRGLMPLANGTLFSARRATPLPGYPRVDRRPITDARSTEILIEESFSARGRWEPVLFHVLLPPRYVIRPDRTPFTLTTAAHIARKADRLFFTLPTVGGADLRFWIAPLVEHESFDAYDLGKLLTAPTKRQGPKVAFELNFGIAKLKIG